SLLLRAIPSAAAEYPQLFLCPGCPSVHPPATGLAYSITPGQSQRAAAGLQTKYREKHLSCCAIRHGQASASLRFLFLPWGGRLLCPPRRCFRRPSFVRSIEKIGRQCRFPFLIHVSASARSESAETGSFLHPHLFPGKAVLKDCFSLNPSGLAAWQNHLCPDGSRHCAGRFRRHSVW